jgi:hypothetical protein
MLFSCRVLKVTGKQAYSNKKMSRILFLFVIIFLSMYAFAQTDSNRHIWLHIVHGSKPKAPGEYRSIGGYYGGHTVIQIDTFLYGFNFNSRRIHIFPRRRNSTGVFEKENLTNWLSDKKKHRITSIAIPLTPQQYAELRSQYEEFVNHSPHDYAFFGMRCASSSYYMLGQIGIVPPCSRNKSIRKAFHPKMLRKRMIKYAAEHNFEIKHQKGSYTRKWEGD